MRFPINQLRRFVHVPSRVALLCLVICLVGSARAADMRDALSHDDALWLIRVTYGLDSATVARFRQSGRRGFLDEQLAARNETLPKPVQSQIDAMRISGTATTQLVADEISEQRRIAMLGDEMAKQEARKTRNQIGGDLAAETAQREVLRAIYSPAQLKEQLVWFWINHFNVFSQKGEVKLLIADYVEHAIRPHALGRFRDLVLATLKHPAMLRYLDNAQNAVNHVNENYARELMELHTLGVEGGYTQADVQQLARVLTGVGIDANPERPRRAEAQVVRDGLFEFNPARHDSGDVTLLGQHVAGGGFDEVERAVDLLTRQEACARFISRKLAMYFVADNPPPRLVDAMARKFQRSNGNIAEVLRVMFESPELDASLGGKFKDPMHYLVSAVRLAYDGRPIVTAKPVTNWLGSLSEPAFGHPTPDGYALNESAWASSGQLSRRLEIARVLANGSPALFTGSDGHVEPAFPRLASRLYYDSIEPSLSKPTLAALDQATSPQEWNLFLLASPEFNYR